MKVVKPWNPLLHLSLGIWRQKWAKKGLRRKSLHAKNGSFFGIGGKKCLSMEKRKNSKSLES